MWGVGGGWVMAGADTQTGEAPGGDAVTIGGRALSEGGGAAVLLGQPDK